MKKRLLADINHIMTQGTVKVLFTKSKEAQTQTYLTGVDKQIGLVGKDALMLRKEIIRETGVQTTQTLMELLGMKVRKKVRKLVDGEV